MGQLKRTLRLSTTYCMYCTYCTRCAVLFLLILLLPTPHALSLFLITWVGRQWTVLSLWLWFVIVSVQLMECVVLFTIHFHLLFATLWQCCCVVCCLRWWILLCLLPHRLRSAPLGLIPYSIYIHSHRHQHQYQYDQHVRSFHLLHCVVVVACFCCSRVHARFGREQHTNVAVVVVVCCSVDGENDDDMDWSMVVPFASFFFSKSIRT